MLEETLKSQLRDVLGKIETPVTLRASLDNSDAASKMRQFLSECATLSENIALHEDGEWDRQPSFSVAAQDGTESIRFTAIPMGHELTSFVLAVLQVGGVPVKLPDATIAQIRDLEGDFQFTTYISLSCQNCPEVVQAINAMCVLNSSFKHEIIDGALFQEEVTRKNIMPVPQIELNGAPFASGRMDAMEILAKLDDAAPAKAAQQYKDAAPFDVLIIGGGPAGAAAAIYAARKGLGRASSRIALAVRSWKQRTLKIIFRSRRRMARNYPLSLKPMSAPMKWKSFPARRRSGSFPRQNRTLIIRSL